MLNCISRNNSRGDKTLELSLAPPGGRCPHEINLLKPTGHVMPCLWGPCHHGVARRQVADRGTASGTEGRCELIE